MIARLWHGEVAAELAEEYLVRMRTVAIPDYRSTEGNVGAWCLTRAEGDVVHFEMFTLWDSIDSIERFAGSEVDRAKYYDFDQQFLRELEPTARHYTAFDR